MFYLRPYFINIISKGTTKNLIQSFAPNVIIPAHPSLEKFVHVYMGQKNQDGYFAEYCHFFKLCSLNTPILKQAQTKVNNSSALFCM